MNEKNKMNLAKDSVVYDIDYGEGKVTNDLEDGIVEVLFKNNGYFYYNLDGVRQGNTNNNRSLFMLGGYMRLLRLVNNEKWHRLRRNQIAANS